MKCKTCGNEKGFIEIEIYCEACGGHGALKCPVCGDVYDNVMDTWESESVD